MKITNWHTAGRSNQAKTKEVQLQSVYKNQYSKTPIQITINDRSDPEKILFTSLHLSLDEAFRLKEKLDLLLSNEAVKEKETE